MLSHSPTTYKIPHITDVPPVFNVEFFDNRANRINVYSSKGVGEPPLLLAISVWTAVKHALSFVSGRQVPQLNLPATNEEVLRRLSEYAFCRTPQPEPSVAVGSRLDHSFSASPKECS